MHGECRGRRRHRPGGRPAWSHRGRALRRASPSSGPAPPAGEDRADDGDPGGMETADQRRGSQPGDERPQREGGDRGTEGPAGESEVLLERGVAWPDVRKQGAVGQEQQGHGQARSPIGPCGAGFGRGSRGGAGRCPTVCGPAVSDRSVNF